MNNVYAEIDNIYSILKIQDIKKTPSNKLNSGTMGRRLNTNFSAITGNKKNTAWSNSSK